MLDLKQGSIAWTFFSFLKIAQRKPTFGGFKIVKSDTLFVNGLNMMLRISLN